MHVVQDIDGTNLARGIAGEGLIKLTLMAASGFSDPGSTYFPAESITIDSFEGVAALHKLCEELMDAYAEQNHGALT